MGGGLTGEVFCVPQPVLPLTRLLRCPWNPPLRRMRQTRLRQNKEAPGATIAAVLAERYDGAGVSASLIWLQRSSEALVSDSIGA